MEVKHLKGVRFLSFNLMRNSLSILVTTNSSWFCIAEVKNPTENPHKQLIPIKIK